MLATADPAEMFSSKDELESSKLLVC